MDKLAILIASLVATGAIVSNTITADLKNKQIPVQETPVVKTWDYEFTDNCDRTFRLTEAQYIMLRDEIFNAITTTQTIDPCFLDLLVKMFDTEAKKEKIRMNITKENSGGVNILKSINGIIKSNERARVMGGINSPK